VVIGDRTPSTVHGCQIHSSTMAEPTTDEKDLRIPARANLLPVGSFQAQYNPPKYRLYKWRFVGVVGLVSSSLDTRHVVAEVYGTVTPVPIERRRSHGAMVRAHIQ
jgi:hypothetical protein